MTQEEITEIIQFLHKLLDKSKNSIEFIYQVAIIFNDILLKYIHDIIEPAMWDELQSAFQEKYKNYLIYEDDLPIYRDLKACLNMLHAIEKATAKMIFSHGDPVLNLFNKLHILHDAYAFRHNYKIVSATNNILTHYISDAKKFVITVIMPEVIQIISQGVQYITHENLAKVENAFIEQMIEMEKYEENYARKKKLNLKENEIDKKAALEDDFVTILVKKSDSVVKKIYPEEYFSRENKTDNSNTLENFLNYYDINTKDTETIKNIKLLFNGMIGLKKVLNDHEEYQQSGFFQSVGWMTTFIKDLRRAYNSLFQFDYQAIIAEQSRPFIEEIKRQLKKLNLLLEKLACIADKLENELHLKDGYLLNHVELLLDRYNQITYELRIPIDYIRQKHVYYKARLDAHENDLMEIERQLIKLRHFLIFKNVPLGDIPYDTIVSLKDYIEKYNDDICMNRDRLDIYKDYLTDTLNTKRNLETFILSHFEMAANYLGLTIHNELMQSLRSRMLYLKKQQDFLEKRFADILEYYKQTPYIYFKPHDKADAILPKLKKHIESLTQEKEILSKKSEEELKNNKTSKLEEIKPRLANQLQLKTNELCFFQSFIKKYEETNEVNPIEEKDILPPKSAMMIKEITEIVLHGNHAPKTHAP